MFDESGKQGDSDHVVFAGFYATSEQWDLFSHEWNGKLRKHGLTYWRTSKAAQLAGEFKKFRGRRRDLKNLTVSLVETICQYAWGATASSISMADYRALSDDTRARFKDPLYCAFEADIKSLVGGEGVEPLDRFNLLCDDSDEYSGDCLRVYRELRKLEPSLADKIGSLCFVNDQTYPPIQAADLIAFCRRKELEGKSKGVWGEVMTAFNSTYTVRELKDIISADLKAVW